MPTTHIVQQGENLFTIARQHKIANWRDIYFHDANAAFRKKRPNPNIICAGDEIQIPQTESKSVTVRTGAHHVFYVDRETQKLTLRLLDESGRPKSKVPAELSINGNKKPVVSGTDGTLKLEVDDPNVKVMHLDVFADPDMTEPSHRFELQLAHLDPADTLAGLQARLNSLGHDCGVVDGIYGRRTKEGIMSYQAACNMTVDGQPSPDIYHAAQKDFGC
ncbi:peptidoglycan-binding protein [Ketobacter sp.]|uniref:PGRP and LysM peptidoglycan-binding domain-containing protein n=1 Tax=Ketobacter sp. TaxID=2083498 RepID=UPI000F15DED9|nr:peptidoglycan-binding protein [Ketobacter sp.]RLT96862.1 MAG: hypothetical protein D9N14_12580 [Ketobacter sp.]